MKWTNQEWSKRFLVHVDVENDSRCID